MKRVALILAFALLSTVGFSQIISFGKQTPNSLNWHQLDLEKEDVWGISLHKAYDFLKQYEPRQRVVVAVIDSGGDINHEDLKDVLWVNRGEIPGDGIDNDGNGYVDDIHGWNFVGFPDGRVIETGIEEADREFIRLRDKYLEADTLKLTAQQMETYRYFHKKVGPKSKVYRDYKAMAEIMRYINYAEEYKSALSKSFPEPDYVLRYTDFDKISNKDKNDILANRAFDFFNEKLRDLPVHRVDSLMATSDSWEKDFRERYNKKCESIIKDIELRMSVDPEQHDISKRYYGNPNVAARSAMHGTHVGGIIGQTRGNSLGIDGIADVELMFVRMIADGEDETDKNVAAAIMYAVENGAKVINMSFGKYLSSNPDLVSQAIAYAEEKGVLLVHAAGNNGINIDNIDRYPTKHLTDGRKATNMIDVGASNSKGQPARFSNYGKEVDLFAPGADIYATVPGNKYQPLSGTSMASPVVAGVAALILNYFPDLTPEQVIDILKRSVTSSKGQVVVRPGKTGDKVMVDFGELSDTGGIINAYNAVQLAAKFKQMQTPVNAK